MAVRERFDIEVPQTILAASPFFGFQNKSWPETWGPGLEREGRADSFWTSPDHHYVINLAPLGLACQLRAFANP